VRPAWNEFLARLRRAAGRACLLAGLTASLMAVAAPTALAAEDGFSFGVLPPLQNGSGMLLGQAIDASNLANLAFVTVHGVRAKGEPCSVPLYRQRHAEMEHAGHGLIVTLAGHDWISCGASNGDIPIAGERLRHLRDIFFQGEYSLGATKLPLTRQSAIPKFRSYGENVRWELGPIMFASLNLPAPNNHYLAAAGRNSEFEDRLVANQDWLSHLFVLARLQKMRGVVIFVDGDPDLLSSHSDAAAGRDGFREIRRALRRHARDFPGQVLLVHGQEAPTVGALRADGKRQPQNAGIQWQGNTGVLAGRSHWQRVQVDPASERLFAVTPR